MKTLVTVAAVLWAAGFVSGCSKCDVTTCPDGCCSSEGTCEVPSGANCGAKGGLCTFCGVGASCDNGLCNGPTATSTGTTGLTGANTSGSGSTTGNGNACLGNACSAFMPCCSGATCEAQAHVCIPTITTPTSSTSGSSGGGCVGQMCATNNPCCDSAVCVDSFCIPNVAGAISGVSATGGSSGSVAAAGSTGGGSQCQTAADCPYSNPGCNNGNCGDCEYTSECPANDTCVNHQCACADNTGCGGNAPVCFASDGGACGCTGDTDCGTGNVCDQADFFYGACTANCTADAGACELNVLNTVCDSTPTSSTYGHCLPCTGDAQCQASHLGQFCTANGCANCTSDSYCGGLDAGTPYCAGTCLQCRNYADCAAGEGCGAGVCGTCISNEDCPVGEGCAADATCADICLQSAPVAGCAPCATNGDCSSGDYCIGGYCGTNVDAGPPPTPDAGRNVQPVQCGSSVCSGQVCNPTTMTCVDCLTSADCTNGGLPTCNTTNNTCVACILPTDCPYSAPGCYEGQCGQCGASTDCPANETCGGMAGCQCSNNSGCGGDAPVCITDAGNCGCTATADCASLGASEICDRTNTSAGKCVVNCATGGSCTDFDAPDCDTATSSPTYGLCLACLNNAECTSVENGTRPYCTSHGCKQCRNNTDCQALGTADPFCSSQGNCVQCTSPSNCATGQGCNPQIGICGVCATSADCPSSAPTCGSNFSCQ